MSAILGAAIWAVPAPHSRSPLIGQLGDDLSRRRRSVAGAACARAEIRAAGRTTAEKALRRLHEGGAGGLTERGAAQDWAGPDWPGAPAAPVAQGGSSTGMSHGGRPPFPSGKRPPASSATLGAHCGTGSGGRKEMGGAGRADAVGGGGA
jgi:hypothetical protein